MFWACLVTKGMGVCHPILDKLRTMFEEDPAKK